MFLGTMRSTKSRNSTNFAMINGARQPPRPTPSMVNYSDEDSAKGYDENPDDSDSLTEKPSEISSTDSQVCLKNLYQFWKLWKFFKVAIFCKLKKKRKKNWLHWYAFQLSFTIRTVLHFNSRKKKLLNSHRSRTTKHS